jgi:hypothetical protein
MHFIFLIKKVRLLVEGNFDVIKMHGTTIKKQVPVKSKYCPSVAGPKIKTDVGNILPKR